MKSKKKFSKPGKSLTLNKRDLETVVLGLRFAMAYETEWKGCNAHMTDKESLEMLTESDKLIRKFGNIKRKIQAVLTNK